MPPFNNQDDDQRQQQNLMNPSQMSDSPLPNSADLFGIKLAEEGGTYPSKSNKLMNDLDQNESEHVHVIFQNIVTSQQSNTERERFTPRNYQEMNGEIMSRGNIDPVNTGSRVEESLAKKSNGPSILSQERSTTSLKKNKNHSSFKKIKIDLMKIGGNEAIVQSKPSAIPVKSNS